MEDGLKSFPRSALSMGGSSQITGGAATLPPLTITATAIATVPLIVKAIAGQTADLQQWQDSTGAVVAKISSGGNIRVALTVSDINASGPFLSLGASSLVANARTATNVGFSVQGAASQSADLQRWTDSTPTTVARVDQSGAIAPQNGARLTSGSGAPTTPGSVNPTAGDIYFRTDTPTVANQKIYICTVGGGSPTWVGIV